MIDAIASFGGFEIMAEIGFRLWHHQTNALKVPGVGFVICKKSSLIAGEGRSPSAVLICMHNGPLWKKKDGFVLRLPLCYCNWSCGEETQS